MSLHLSFAASAVALFLHMLRNIRTHNHLALPMTQPASLTKVGHFVSDFNKYESELHSAFHLTYCVHDVNFQDFRKYESLITYAYAGFRCLLRVGTPYWWYQGEG